MVSRLYIDSYCSLYIDVTLTGAWGWGGRRRVVGGIFEAVGGAELRPTLV